MPAVIEAAEVRETPHIVHWEANRSGTRITIVGMIDGFSGRLSVDTISASNGQVVAWKDGALVATLGLEGLR